MSRQCLGKVTLSLVLALPVTQQQQHAVPRSRLRPPAALLSFHLTAARGAGALAFDARGDRGHGRVRAWGWSFFLFDHVDYKKLVTLWQRPAHQLPIGVLKNLAPDDDNDAGDLACFLFCYLRR